MAKGISTAARYHKAKSPEDYLEQRLSYEGPCHLWVKGVDKDGYGQCHDSKWAKILGVTRAHQLAYVTFRGEIPKGLVVCHTCDTPSCCNPEHLFLGTVADNNRDCAEKGRQRNGAKKNPHTEEILKLWGIKPCGEVAEVFGISFGRVCQMWRGGGKNGRNFY